ncbi:hypothetical protein [Acidisphaera sp. S103]|uniref:hypothetical protein n=1 Tax=Acidisphaera sp. S103 TaxID=1747223 RepID=UPI00131DFB4F|nr:hypothetical protein [Acidisphaera sp. S103]
MRSPIILVAAGILLAGCVSNPTPPVPSFASYAQPPSFPSYHYTPPQPAPYVPACCDGGTREAPSYELPPLVAAPTVRQAPPPDPVQRAAVSTPPRPAINPDNSDCAGWWRMSLLWCGS